MLCFLKKESLNRQSPFWLFPVPQVATIVVLLCSVWYVCEGSLGIYSIILFPYMSLILSICFFLFQAMFNCILHWDGKMYVFLTAILYADGVDKLQFAQSFLLMDISFFFF